MNTFILYSIDKPTDPRASSAANLAANLTRACASYKRRRGIEPNVVTISRADVPVGFSFDGLRLDIVDDIKLKNQFRLWREERC